MKAIHIFDARENNLNGFDLEIPHHAITCVTGVSGSGKSSLAYGILCREGQRRYLDSFSSFARQYLGKLGGPDVGGISGLMPAIAVDQRTIVRTPRSTVGTLTELHDYLRLLFARLGQSPSVNAPLSRAMFSFNDVEGACPHCKGLGVEDRIDPELLVADAAKSLRQGALAITTPSGYTIYSQVTIDVLDQVCRSEGFDVDTPWHELAEEHRRVVLWGSDKIRIPYGKHPLESRMRWTGITAKPREEGTYKGILPVMETILRTSRNDNILRFARTQPCSECAGHRLNERARSVRVQRWTMADLTSLSIRELAQTFSEASWRPDELPIAGPVSERVIHRCSTLQSLGLDYLTLDRASNTLSGGEAQRIRLATQSSAELRGVLYVLDEPSIGLHPVDNERMIALIRGFRDRGNTVVVVEHDLETMRHADWLIDIGPGAGKEGGRVVLNASLGDLPRCHAPESRTLPLLLQDSPSPLNDRTPQKEDRWLSLHGIRHHNLAGIDVQFLEGAVNVVTGVSGAGKSSLAMDTLVPAAQGRLPAGRVLEIRGFQAVRKVVAVDQRPIGRTPRSNPATYTKVFDSIRKLYADQPIAKQRGWSASRFSFNTAGGRCETCEGAGVQQTGMHFMGSVESRCEHCHGRRFDEATLEVVFRDASIADVLAMDVRDACAFFEDIPPIARVLLALRRFGLGYLPLGQPATTLSGGEAQRIKLAAELARPSKRGTLIVLDEPTTGLHDDDVRRLFAALKHLAGEGNTVVIVEHHDAIVRQADHVVDLGPGSGDLGGRVVFQGSPAGLAACPTSLTGRHLTAPRAPGRVSPPVPQEVIDAPIELNGVATHNLRNVDVAFPRNRLTVVTGVSGSGKSSLAFDTLFAEGQHRFLESFSSYARQLVGQKERPTIAEVRGLTPTIAVDRSSASRHPRSTVGTVTGLHDLYRLLWSRIGRNEHGRRVGLLSSHFSFNHEAGACPGCTGLGTILTCDPDRLLSNPEQGLFDGAMSGSKTGQFLGEPHGQHMATLKQVGCEHDIDFANPWKDLSERARAIALHGTGPREYDVVWRYRRKNRTGEHAFRGTWDGLIAYVNDEFTRKHEQKRGSDVRALMREDPCGHCGGSRLRPERLRVFVLGTSIAYLCGLSCAAARQQLEDWLERLPNEDHPIAELILPAVQRRLDTLCDLGLGYLCAERGTTSLSGGEANRVRLAAQLGARLTGITYVLDEPTIGLHARDTQRLITVLEQLRDQGNTVVVVEHDRSILGKADHVIELGPGAGAEGGRVVHTGSCARRSTNGAAGWPKLPPPRADAGHIDVRGAHAHNLRSVDAVLPLGALTVFAGVSGSGKSSLAFDVLAASARARRCVACEHLEGWEWVDDILEVDDAPIGTTPQSTLASFTGLLERLRAMFASSAAAKTAGLTKSHFSYLTKAGGCEACQGHGQQRVAMDFLGDVWVPCRRCGGRRYRDEVLAVEVGGKTIADVLDSTVATLAETLGGDSVLRSGLQLLAEIGLGHVRMGQSAPTLSGGEARRLRLARALLARTRGRTLFILDEPTQGLHDDDVGKLMGLFARLLTQGHSLWVVEHHVDVIAAAHQVVEFGPEAGERGGLIVFAGPPEQLAVQNTPTGRVLRSACN